MRTQRHVTAAKSVGLVANGEERIELTRVSTEVGKEMDVARRDCYPVHVGNLATAGLGKGRRREGNILFGKNGGWKGGNRTLG